MKLIINSISDIAKIHEQDFVDKKITKVIIKDTDMSNYVGKLLLATKIQNKALNKFARERNIIEAAIWVYQFEYAYIPDAVIDNKFRATLSENDKTILLSVFLLNRIAEKLLSA